MIARPRLVVVLLASLPMCAVPNFQADDPPPPLPSPTRGEGAHEADTTSGEGVPDALAYDRPAGFPRQSRSVVIAEHGMVATSHPLAAQAALQVLLEGGNAVDAAITANAVLGVVEPMSCGIGGDLFAIVWMDGGEQSPDVNGTVPCGQLYGLNASGRAPYNLNREVFESMGLEQIPTYGPLSWSVPGCVDGWETLRARFGTMPLSRLLEPAIRYAEDGFPVSEIIGAGWAGSVENLSQWPDSARTYLRDDGTAPPIGSLFRLPALANTLRLIADGGRDAFYRGPIAEQIVAFSEANGGYFSMRDFQEHTSEWVEPVSTNYRGYDVWELPPNGQGIAVLQILNVLSGHDVGSMEYHSAEHLHLLIEATKLAFTDRARYYADPAFAEVPVAELISREYAERQRARIDPAHAATDWTPGDPRLSASETVYLTVVDRDRNCVSLIQSLYHGFGSQMVPGELGFALQNRGALFSLDPEHPNRLEPHKRPFHTIIPGFVTHQGRPFFSFGVMGGDMQPQGHVQVLSNILDFHMNVQASGDAARVCILGHPTPTGVPGEDAGGRVALESGIGAEARAGLQQRGHTLTTAVGSFGGYQGILIDPETGLLHGGSDPRKDGCAVGY